MVFANLFVNTIFFVYLCSRNKQTSNMNIRKIMYISIIVSVIITEICAIVLTYNYTCKVRFSCEVGGSSATYFVDYGDEESMSLLYAQVVYAIKNADKVYKENKKRESQSISCETDTIKYPQFLVKLREKAIARAAERKQRQIERERNKPLTESERQIQLHREAMIKASVESLMKDSAHIKFMEQHAPRINWDSIIRSDLEQANNNNPIGGMY